MRQRIWKEAKKAQREFDKKASRLIGRKVVNGLYIRKPYKHTELT